MNHYILKDKKVIDLGDGKDSLLKWSMWFESNPEKRRVEETTLKNGVWVSTVFLGIDHNFGIGKKPILFETIAFNTNKREIYKIRGKSFKGIGEELCQERYYSYEQAELGHKRIVNRYRKYDRKNLPTTND